jgi:NADH-quinone oxidoreductase subunit A
VTPVPPPGGPEPRRPRRPAGAQVRSGVASLPSLRAARCTLLPPACRDVPGRWADAVDAFVLANGLFDNWVAVAFGAVIGIILVATALIANLVLAPRAPSRAKGTPFECGMLPIGRAAGRIHFRYYLFAILFLIFDVEAVFLFPWAVTFLDAGKAAFWEMVLFVGILIGGLAYAWKRGVLTWR